MDLDLTLFNAIFSLAHQSKLLDWLIVFLAEYLGYILVIGFLLLVFLEKNWRQRFYGLAFGVLAVILSRGILTQIIRHVHYRLRPVWTLNIVPLIDHSKEASFPSGHMAFFLALALVVFFLNHRWGYWFILAALLIGIARVAAGVHWPLDILGGIVVAILSVFVVRWLLARSLPK